VSVVLVSALALLAGAAGLAVGGWTIALAAVVLAAGSACIGAYWGAARRP
jgi:hypothetical protein